MHRLIDVTIGWTMSDRATGYSSFDGYRHGAKQHTETVTVDVHVDNAEPEAVVLMLAEAAYVATNDPNPHGIAKAVREAIDATGYVGREAGHYSLSVGDTVSVGEVAFACQPFGWERVRLIAAV